jgi:hypothetical protein
MNSKFSMLSAPLKAAPALTQLLAIGSVALGVAAIIPAAPAQAISLTGGELDFSGKTTGFYTAVNTGTGLAPVLAPSFTFDFNKNISNVAQQASVDFTTGPFASLYPSTPVNSNISAPTGSFLLVGGPALGTFTYKLTNNLDFLFASGVNLHIGAGSTFDGFFSGTGNNTVSFGLNNPVGSYFSDTPNANLESLAFTFSDIRNRTGSYSIAAVSVTVPEPFTIIGSLVGGTAALRMRKKLKATTKV